MKVTVKEIAENSGVSTATVSNVLTKKKYVSPEIEKRVLSSIKKLKYVPNAHARNLKINKSKTIGIQIPDITNPFFADIVKYAQIEADTKDYQIILCSSNGDIKSEEKNLIEFLKNRVDGIVNVAPRMKSKKIENIIDIPMVIVDRNSFKTKKNIGFVYSDNYKGATLVADYFVAKKYTKYLCFSGPTDIVPNANMRTEGFIDRLLELGVKKEQCDVYYCDFSFELGYQNMKQLILKNKLPKPCAAFISSDILAWGTMEALKKYGYKIPEDIAIVGYDNIYLTNFISPNLSTVNNPSAKFGKTSVEIMIDALDKGHSLNKVNIVLESSLILRYST